MRAGLGNMLFPWSRCVVWADEHDARIIAPFWTKIRVGPYLRREVDKRQYQRLFEHPEDQVSGLRRLWLLATRDIVPEEEFDGPPEEGSIACFEGMGDQFDPLIGHHETIRSELLGITKERYIDEVPAQDPFVAVNIRRGDFVEPDDLDRLRNGEVNLRIPLEWYIHVVEELRDALGSLPVRVISDGWRHELEPILELDDTELYRGSAITEMLAMSESSVLVGSASTFSRWGAFLGQTPSVWFPSQRQRLIAGSEADHLEVEVDMDEAVPATFTDSFLKRYPDL